MITKVRKLDQATAFSENFEYNPNTTTGLNFGHRGGVVDHLGTLTTLSATTVAIPSNGVYVVYINQDDPPTALSVGTLAAIPTTVRRYIPLYEITTGSSSITDVKDLRSFTTFSLKGD